MKMLFKNPILWWKFEGRYYHRDLYWGIKNLIIWFHIIWKDRDWDSNFIYKILQHKLKLQAKGIAKRDIHVDAKRDAEIMMTCVRLIDKINDEYYQYEYSNYHKSKYWFEDIDDKPGYSTWESEIESEDFDNFFKKYPLIYKRVLNGEGWVKYDEKNTESERKMRMTMNIGHINQERAKTLLFKILNNNIEKWWD
jgi:hypothetical protein